MTWVYNLRLDDGGIHVGNIVNASHTRWLKERKVDYDLAVLFHCVVEVIPAANSSHLSYEISVIGEGTKLCIIRGP